MSNPQHTVWRELVAQLEGRLAAWERELKALEEAEVQKLHLGGLIQHAKAELARLRKLLPEGSATPEAPLGGAVGSTPVAPPRPVIRPVGSPSAPGSPGNAQTVQGRPRP
jgi:hypothetical protein